MLCFVDNSTSHCIISLNCFEFDDKLRWHLYSNLWCGTFSSRTTKYIFFFKPKTTTKKQCVIDICTNCLIPLRHLCRCQHCSNKYEIAISNVSKFDTPLHQHTFHFNYFIIVTCPQKKTSVLLLFHVYYFIPHLISVDLYIFFHCMKNTQHFSFFLYYSLCTQNRKSSRPINQLASQTPHRLHKR